RPRQLEPRLGLERRPLTGLQPRPQLAAREQDRGAADGNGAAREGADALGYRERIAPADLDVGGIDAELVRRDLRERRLVALPVRRRARVDDRATVFV